MKFMSQSVEEALSAKTSIIQRLMANMGGSKPERSHEVVHASDITKPSFCPRQYALMDIMKAKKPDSYIDTALQATFDVGNATADLFTNRWAGDSIVGHWKCHRCDKAKSFCTKPKEGCTSQQKCDWRYQEVKFFSNEHHVSGSIDAIMELKAPKYFITELKIIKAEDFVDIVAPLAEHRIRTSMYMKIIDDSDSMYKKSLNLTEARVFYISRGYGKKCVNTGKIVPFKEYVIKRDDASVIPYLERAKQVKLFRSHKIMPQGICNTSMDTHAKKCVMCKECFSGNYPVGQL